jgi:gluconate 5-dehydrogenase
VPMRRLGGPDDISAAAVFLASIGSKYMTGQNLIIDGGWSSW